MSATLQPQILERTSGGRVNAIIETDERRTCVRFSRRVFVHVNVVGSEEGFSTETEDFSEGGIFFHVPHPFSLSVGERCELVIAEKDGLTPLSCLCGESCYATVIRTEFMEPDGCLGAGLRFDQPLFF